MATDYVLRQIIYYDIGLLGTWILVIRTRPLLKHELSLRNQNCNFKFVFEPMMSLSQICLLSSSLFWTETNFRAAPDMAIFHDVTLHIII